MPLIFENDEVDLTCLSCYIHFLFYKKGTPKKEKCKLIKSLA